MILPAISIWRSVPFLRHLLPLMAGILLQYQLHIQPDLLLVTAIIALISLIGFGITPNSAIYIYGWWRGIAFLLVFMATGGGLSYINNIQNRPDWIGTRYMEQAPVLATIIEPPIEKERSFKARARAESVLLDGRWQPVKGDILVYFKKGRERPGINYGSQVIITKTLQPIRNSGNPGTFNYEQYCSFQGIYYQAFLQPSDFRVLQSTSIFFLDDWLIQARNKILGLLREKIHDEKQLGLAEALLIGYRDDLDKALVRSYSNTGVVHIIAISGMHLALIYGLLVLLFRPFQKQRWVRWVKPVTILFVLWGFSFIAGAAPSILRSTVMFSFIVLGNSIGKRGNIYNNLAASAFVILVFDPFSLWDAGFQLSYAAVLSIVIFSGPIRKWFYFNNRILKAAWDLSSVTLSAQILTLPIVLYHFHRIPTMFLLANLFAVPFSGWILYSELLLLAVAKIPWIGTLAGSITGWGIGFMNSFIERVDQLPLSSLDSIYITIPQSVLLYMAIAGVAWWLMKKYAGGLLFGLACLVSFFAIRSIDFIQHNRQQKLVVYNVPQHSAIDIIEGRNYQFTGDSNIQMETFTNDFYLQPSRILHRISEKDTLASIQFQNNLISSSHKNILVIDAATQKIIPAKRIQLDAIILTKNPKINLTRLSEQFNCSLYIFDASNSLWKINKWKKEADSLHLRHYSVHEQGALIMDL